MTPEQYLEIDSRAERPSEYYNGEMFVVGATTERHSLIQVNLSAFLHARLQGRPCKGLGSTIRVQIPQGPYYYPDFVVACGKREYAAYDTLLNPTAVFEILSESTANYDLGRKGELYQTIPSLQEYIVIEQKCPRARRWTRQSANKWLVERISGLDKVLAVEAIGCEIPFSDLYFEVDLDPQE